MPSLVNYLATKNQLQNLIEIEPLNSPKRQRAQRVVNKIEKLTDDGKLPIDESIELLNDTTHLLNKTITPDAYRAKAQKVQGSPSLALKILGGLMLALGTIIAGICIAVGATTGIVLSGEGVTGAGVAAAGIGFFSGGLRGGLSQAMTDLADKANDNSFQVN